MRLAPALADQALRLALRCTLGGALALSLGCTGKTGAPNPSPKAQAKPAATEPGGSPALLDPSLATATAPDEFKVQLETTKGNVVLQLHREWSPLGADRFYNMVQAGFFENVAFFRAIDNFMVQFGVSGEPSVQRAWNAYPIQDEPPKQSNKRGYITFAKGGPNSRTTQVFINFKDNKMLDSMGFAPFGEVVEGMDVVDSLYKGYGESAPKGKGPNQLQLGREGNAYLERDFPELDYVKKATILE